MNDIITEINMKYEVLLSVCPPSDQNLLVTFFWWRIIAAPQSKIANPKRASKLTAGLK